MSQNFKNENKSFCLPPSVSGKLHGFLTLTIEDIRWTTTKKFSAVDVQLKWWGESEGISLKINSALNNDTTKKVYYRVNTNFRLLENYLRHCEPIAVQLFSIKNKDLIGCVRIGIPAKLHNNVEEDPVTNLRVSSAILGHRNFKIGEMTVSFGIESNDNSNISFKTRPEREGAKHVTFKLNEKQQSEKKVLSSSNKENIAVVGTKKPILVRNAKPLKVSTLKPRSAPQPLATKKPINHITRSSTAPSPSSSSSITSTSTTATTNSSLINYLMGRSMSKSDEAKTLTALIETSPSQSVIDELDKISLEFDRTQQINSINVTINALELSSLGLAEVRSFIGSLHNRKCVIKCAITSKLIKAKADDSNFISYVFDAASQKVDFRNKALIYDIQMPTKNIANAYLNFGFCLKSIEGEKHPLLLGFCRVNVKEVLNSKPCFYKRCPVISSESEMKIGIANLRINLGSDHDMNNFNKENHPKFHEPCNAAIRRSAPPQHSHHHCSIQRPVPLRLIDQTVQTTCHPSSSNDCENSSDRRDYESKNVKTNDENSRASNNMNSKSNELEENHNRDTEMVDVEMKENILKPKIYHVLMFIENLRNVKDTGREYFITYEGFWNQCQESTEVSLNYFFNYLKQSPIMCDDAFLKRVQNNHLELKLWEKTSDNSEKWVGSTRVPLHQFYIAFKDIAMIEHLSTNKLPIISTDSWCNFISPLSSELFCQAKILLAIGNEHQIDYLIMSRSLHQLRQPVSEQRQQQPQPAAAPKFSETNAQLKSKLSAFIESLSQKLPEPCSGGSQQKAQILSSQSNSSFDSVNSIPPPQQQQQQLRKTSDLLESLQKALSKPPTADDLSLFAPPAVPQAQSPEELNATNTSMTPNDDIRMAITIEAAANLPKVIVKKNRNKRKSKSGGTSPQQRAEYDPISYATFEATIGSDCQTSIVKSHEGNVYCTKVLKGCNPQWNEVFEVGVPFDILRNPQKRFVVKVWRKAKFDQQQQFTPKPFEDAVIGFSAIDLSALLTGLPRLSGYYNIVDFSGRTNGQIQLSFKPLQDIDAFRSPSSPLVPLTCPLNIDVNCMETSSDGSSILSRTLKRKFTELDEITQRLKARLFDVTGDENFDPDEEFERDLNTAVEDEEDGNECVKEDFAWLRKDDDGNGFQAQLNKILDPHQPSTSKGTPTVGSSSIPTHREISGCSGSDDEPPPFVIDQLLKKYDLDTLINPNIFKNIIDPNAADSDSTPTLVPKQIENTDGTDGNAESADTTVSSIISNDQLQTIQKALQRTSLHEPETQEISNKDRKDPEGEQNASE